MPMHNKRFFVFFLSFLKNLKRHYTESRQLQTVSQKFFKLKKGMIDGRANKKRLQEDILLCGFSCNKKKCFNFDFFFYPFRKKEKKHIFLFALKFMMQLR